MGRPRCWAGATVSPSCSPAGIALPFSLIPPSLPVPFPPPYLTHVLSSLLPSLSPLLLPPLSHALPRALPYPLSFPQFVSSQRAVEIAGTAATPEDAAHALVETAQKEWAIRYRGRNVDDITVGVAFL